MAKSPLRFKPGVKKKYYSFIGIDDLVAALHAALNQKPGPSHQGIYFIASDQVITDAELIQTAGQAAGRFGLLAPIPQKILRPVVGFLNRIPKVEKYLPDSLNKDRAHEIWPERWVISNQKFKDRFDWVPTQALLPALRATYQWYQKTGQL